MWILDWLDGQGAHSFHGMTARGLRRLRDAASVTETLMLFAAAMLLVASLWFATSPEAAEPATVWDATPYAANGLWLPAAALGVVLFALSLSADHLRLDAKEAISTRSQAEGAFDLFVYVIGPVSGRTDGNRAAFMAARQSLLDAGAAHVVIPHDGIPADAEWTPAMAKSLAMLLEADVVAALDDWAESPGASLEVAFCKEMGIPWRTVSTLKSELSRAREGEEVIIR